MDNSYGQAVSKKSLKFNLHFCTIKVFLHNKISSSTFRGKSIWKFFRLDFRLRASVIRVKWSGRHSAEKERERESKKYKIGEKGGSNKGS